MSEKATWNYAKKWHTCRYCNLTAPDVELDPGSPEGLHMCPQVPADRCIRVRAKRSLSDDRKFGVSSTEEK